MTTPRLNEWPSWPDARGWIGVGVFVLTGAILYIIANYPEMRDDDFFQSIAVLIVGTGFINGVVSWAYSATQGGGEVANRNAAVAQTLADKATIQKGDTQKVEVINPPSNPVHTEEAVVGQRSDEEELPDYARP